MPVSKSVPSDLPRVLADITPETLGQVIQKGLATGGDYCDVYIESRFAQSVMLEEGLIKETSEHRQLGAGVRVMDGAIAGYAYTNDLTPEGLGEAARTASAVARRSAQPAPIHLSSPTTIDDVYDRRHPGYLADLETKIDLVKRAEAAALAYDGRVDKVQVSLADSMQWVLMADSDGRLALDSRPQMRLSVSAMAQDGDQRHTGNASAGGRVGMAHFVDAGSPEALGREAAEEAITLLEAVDPAPGMQPVVLGAKHSGVMIHEAVGHPLEADGHWKKTAVLHPYWQQMVASEIVTIVDDPTLPGLRGSLAIDDEGQSAKRTVLIEKGRLVGLLNDRLSAIKLGHAPNGHGRRDGYTSLPVPRMTNTFLLPGEADEEAIIRSVKKGFYAHSFQGGMVQNSGKFTFSVNLGWLIEKGRLTRPVKNATLIGHNLEILKQIEMVGRDTGWFLGTCGKDGQSAAVTAGTPTLKITGMTVGGR